MKILIATGIFPPHVGGPSQYAKELRDVFGRLGHTVRVRTFTVERFLPTGVRHIIFFIRLLFSMYGVDYVVALDQFSVGFPSVCAGLLLRKKVIIRSGGDFLWEWYVERTEDLTLYKNFYSEAKQRLNLKERIILKVTRFTLYNAHRVVFSTQWQKEIIEKEYNLFPEKIFVIENYFGPKEEDQGFKEPKIFLGGVRQLKWKNTLRLKAAFEKAKKAAPGIMLDMANAPYDAFLKKMRESYAVILVSLGDISPNMILDAIRLVKPFIFTKENGLLNRIGSIGIYVDPENEDDIERAIVQLLKPEVYEAEKRKIQAFNFIHTWEDIGREFLKLM